MLQYLKSKEIIESGDRYIVCDIAKTVGILLSRVHFILTRFSFQSTNDFCQMDIYQSTERRAKKGTRTNGQAISKTVSKVPNQRKFAKIIT